MSSVKEIHMMRCKNFNATLDLSLDGVQESKSSSMSADVYSVSFKNCRTVYPIRIIRCFNKFKIDEQFHFKLVLDDIKRNGLKLNGGIFDNPKRAFVRCAKNHAGYYACEYCESKAHYIKNTDEDTNSKGQLAWPFSTSNGPLRTREKIEEIVEKIRNEEPLTRDEAKGFLGSSHLLDEEDFDFITKLPAEYMHSGCIGVVKRLVELTFNVGDNRKRKVTRKLSDVSLYNRLISAIKVVREFSRKNRNLDFGVMKAQEFRNLILFYFNLVLECIPDTFPKEQKLWLQLAYFMRACVLPNKEFNEIPEMLITNTATSFYKNFETIYGPKQCSYSVHVIASHIQQIRGDVPLPEMSAFKFENFYSELRNLFQPGTTSPSKQILQNCFMKRQLEFHCCEKSIFYDVEKNGKENNSLVYFVDDDNEYQFFKIIKVNPDGTLTCNPQGRHLFETEKLAKELKWEKVGVFRVGPHSTEEVILTRDILHGKVLKVNDLFITCPNEVLREQ